MDKGKSWCKLDYVMAYRSCRWEKEPAVIRQSLIFF